MPYIVRFASTAEDRELAYALRRDVFETEQNVPRPLDRDTHDHNANHVVALDEQGSCVGTGRLVRLDARTSQIGRMAVARSHRRQGVGERIIEMLEQLAVMRGIGDIVCHVQLPAIPFFEHLGYVREGEEIQLEGVPHVLMRRNLLSRAAG
ncbi:MAG: GNAT family N-acetyltransferase [Anaeromyxobacteraceae bacterium]|nr:GNAT family N-acetyltransferase [Anaeromyxobacteraceae bacterium]